jgi:hypothetical protein
VDNLLARCKFGGFDFDFQLMYSHVCEVAGRSPVQNNYRNNYTPMGPDAVNKKMRAR